jgi:hypothetical protein
MKLIEQIYNKFKASAIERNIDFELTIEQLVGLLYGQSFRCYLTNELFIVEEQQKKVTINTYNLVDCLNTEVARHTVKFKYNCSIDRIDSSKGYTINNVKFCTKRINMFKKDYNLNEFLEMCKKVSQNEIHYRK